MAASLSDYCLQSSHGAEYDVFGHNCQFDKHFLNCNVEHDDCQSSWSKVLSSWHVLSDRKERGFGDENICRDIDRSHYNSSRGALFVTVWKGATLWTIACRSRRWGQGTLSFLNPRFMGKVWSSLAGSCYGNWRWQISTSLCVDW